MNRPIRLAACLPVVLALFTASACAAPPAAADHDDQKIILTPRPGPAPHINGPRLFGVRPGHPLLYRIPCTGQRPIAFTVDHLPQGLQLDPATGIITGHAPRQKGDYRITFHARNTHGSARKDFTLVVGQTLALTPPMGWNSWYIYKHRVSEKHMRQAAQAMIDSGLADAGYMYVNIDDCWMKKRGDEPYRSPDGTQLPNANFPDIKGMVDAIHTLGLRAGLYTSPGPWTCARYVGSLGYELQDARQYARWGFDFLKYDWCSYGRAVHGDIKTDELYASTPYRHMGGLLQLLDRDIVFNLCQYGRCHVWTWGGRVGGNCWRTTGDLGNVAGDQLPGFYHIAFSNMEHWQYAKPGQWNDPDYILIGWVGTELGRQVNGPTSLTGDEQYSYMSLWCLMAAPLIYSGDMTRLDAFTLNVLGNTEVIAVDQDALGKQAKPVRKTDDELVLAKPMEDGSLAVGLFNLAEQPRTITVTWKDLGLTGPQRVRDLWRQKDLAPADRSCNATVNRHGVMLLRLWPKHGYTPDRHRDRDRPARVR